MYSVYLQVLVMAPTRELAKQVSEDFESISEGLSVLCVYGGTPYGPQGEWVTIICAKNTIAFFSFGVWY